MIIEKHDGFGVRVYRGKHRGYEWVGTFKFKAHGGKRGARRAAGRLKRPPRPVRRDTEHSRSATTSSAT
jgi:hypothetical protein